MPLAQTRDLSTADLSVEVGPPAKHLADFIFLVDQRARVVVPSRERVERPSLSNADRLEEVSHLVRGDTAVERIPLAELSEHVVAPALLTRSYHSGCIIQHEIHLSMTRCVENYTYVMLVLRVRTHDPVRRSKTRVLKTLKSTPKALASTELANDQN